MKGAKGVRVERVRSKLSEEVWDSARSKVKISKRESEFEGD